VRLDGKGDKCQREQGCADEEKAACGSFGHSSPPFPPLPRRATARQVCTATRIKAPTPAPEASAMAVSAQPCAPTRPSSGATRIKPAAAMTRTTMATSVRSARTLHTDPLKIKQADRTGI
jgi:hypothetical protein